MSWFENEGKQERGGGERNVDELDLSLCRALSFSLERVQARERGRGGRRGRWRPTRSQRGGQQYDSTSTLLYGNCVEAPSAEGTGASAEGSTPETLMTAPVPSPPAGGWGGA